MGFRTVDLTPARLFACAALLLGARVARARVDAGAPPPPSVGGGPDGGAASSPAAPGAAAETGGGLFEQSQAAAAAPASAAAVEAAPAKPPFTLNGYLRGDLSLVVDDGSRREEITLNSPRLGVHLSPMVWAVQYKFSPDAMLLVLASEKYDPASYIRDYDEYLSLLKSDQ